MTNLLLKFSLLVSKPKLNLTIAALASQMVVADLKEKKKLERRRKSDLGDLGNQTVVAAVDAEMVATVGWLHISGGCNGGIAMEWCAGCTDLELAMDYKGRSKGIKGDSYLNPVEISSELEEQARELPRTQTEDLLPVKEEEWNPNFDYKRWNEDYERLKALFWAEHGDYESRDESRISGTPTTAQSGSSTKSRGSSSKGKKKK
nr:hypothetical protein Iba_chr14dCG1890 [Ipomoea batatas]